MMKKAIVIILGVILGVIVVAYIVGLFSIQEIHTEIPIDAASNKVWSHLVGFKHYPEWNPFIKTLC